MRGHLAVPVWSFVTILPRTRREDAQFRERLLTEGDSIAWDHLYDVTNEQDEVVDWLRVCCDEGVSAEGFRLLWFHSTRKVERDMAARAHAIERTQQELAKLRERLLLPRTRFRDQDKVRKSDFEVAPVYLKEVSRIQSLLCVYFLCCFCRPFWNVSYAVR